MNGIDTRQKVVRATPQEQPSSHPLVTSSGVETSHTSADCQGYPSSSDEFPSPPAPRITARGELSPRLRPAGASLCPRCGSLLRKDREDPEYGRCLSCGPIFLGKALGTPQEETALYKPEPDGSYAAKRVLHLIRRSPGISSPEIKKRLADALLPSEVTAALTVLNRSQYVTCRMTNRAAGRIRRYFPKEVE